MSRVNLKLEPKSIIPQDLRLTFQMVPIGEVVAETVDEVGVPASTYVAPDFQSATTANVATGQTLVINVPAGTEEGDQLMLWISYVFSRKQLNTTGTESFINRTAIATTGAGGNLQSGIALACLSKIVTATPEPASYTINVNNTTQAASAITTGATTTITIPNQGQAPPVGTTARLANFGGLNQGTVNNQTVTITASSTTSISFTSPSTAGLTITAGGAANVRLDYGDILAAMLHYKDIDVLIPWDKGSTNAGSSTAPVALTQTTAYDDAVVQAGFAWKNTSAFTTPTGLDLLATVTGALNKMAICATLQPTAGATGNETAAIATTAIWVSALDVFNSHTFQLIDKSA